MPRLPFAFAAYACGCATFAFAATEPAEEQLPAGVEQILPRGGIPAVFEPEFVAAEEAEIDDDAWILGVEIGGETRAYSLNLLNRHEIVNDRIAGRPVAAVW
jgi:hypothetical protein